MKLKQLVLALAAAAPFAAHATDGYFSHGYGMQAKGMGGASTAVAESAFGAASNPATMAFAGDRWEIGVDLFSPWRKASRSGGTWDKHSVGRQRGKLGHLGQPLARRG